MLDDISPERHEQILKNEKYAEIVADRRAKYDCPKMGESAKPCAKPACKSHAATEHEAAEQSKAQHMEEIEAMLNMYSPAFAEDQEE